jgi:AcrR family transcriptional regulator
LQVSLLMAKKNAKPARRKPRADARRNRERILEIAKVAFTRSGANISLDDVARQAGIGAGTLYRHFPTRDALLEAVYRTEVEKLAAAERELAAALPPIEALRAWMLLFVDYIAAKQIIAPALNTLVGGPSKLFEASGALIKGAIHALVERAIASGDIRPDLDPLDLLRALVGVSNVASVPDWAQSARRLVEILIIGSRADHLERLHGREVG